ncbi:MAG: hypothetical protein AAFZ65_01415 [Planctomycetota bacterium]
MTSNIDATSGDVAELKATVANLEEQLIALYAEKQYGLWTQGDAAVSPDELQTSVSNLEAQYAALLEERDALLSQGSSELREMVDNLEQQYISVLNERDELIANGGLRGYIQMISNLENQYAALLEERNELYANDDAEIAVKSLEAQVGALLEERNELASSLVQHGQHAERAKRRMVDLMSHIVEQEFQTN